MWIALIFRWAFPYKGQACSLHCTGTSLWPTVACPSKTVAMLTLVSWLSTVLSVHMECSKCHPYAEIMQSSQEMPGLFLPKGLLVMN